jgi:hypothetical protein
MGSLTSYNPIGLHGLLRGELYFFTISISSINMMFLMDLYPKLNITRMERVAEMNSGVFWDVMTCSSCEHLRFGRISRLHHQG